jgi:hypothetical protein
VREGWFGGGDCAFVERGRVFVDETRWMDGARDVVLGFSPTRGSRARGRARGARAAWTRAR